MSSNSYINYGATKPIYRIKIIVSQSIVTAATETAK